MQVHNAQWGVTNWSGVQTSTYNKLCLPQPTYLQDTPMQPWYLLSALALLIPCAEAQISTPIEDSMSPQERQATGVETLNPAQLEALNAWLQQHGASASTTDTQEPAATAAITPAAAPVVTTEAPADRWGKREEATDVVSRITGTFTGWSGNTVFNLDNGQVYQQRRPGSWKTQLTDPEVTVGRGFMGVLELEVDGHSIGVKRLR